MTAGDGGNEAAAPNGREGEEEAGDDEPVPPDAEHDEDCGVFEQGVVEGDVAVDAAEFFSVGIGLFDFLRHDACAVG